MIDKKMKNSELQRKAQISGNIITRLNKDEFVSMETVAKICDVLECGVDDILEFTKD
jgi:DNA-binding Xre family transcriptional regulator